MSTPNQSIEQMFKRVREAVKKETKGRQEPMETSNLIGDVMLVPGKQAISFSGDADACTPGMPDAVLARAAVPCCWVLPWPPLRPCPACTAGWMRRSRVINRSGEISTPFPVSMSSNDCRPPACGLRHRGGVRTQPGRRAAHAASRSAAARCCLPRRAQPGGHRYGGILKQIVVVLEGVNRTKNGSSRGAEGDYLAASLPTGQLARAGSRSGLAAGPGAGPNLGSFELLVGGKIGAPPERALAVDQVAPGRAQTGRQRALEAGLFRHQIRRRVRRGAGGTLDALKQRLGNDDPADADELVGKLRVAAALIAEGYAWDARALIRRVLSPCTAAVRPARGALANWDLPAARVYNRSRRRRHACQAGAAYRI